MPRQVGERLRAVRTSLGIRQARLARDMGVSQPYIAAVESGRQNLTLAQIGTIASALGVGVEFVFTVPGDRPRAQPAVEESSLLKQLTALTECAQAAGVSDDAARALQEVRLGLLERLASFRPTVAAYSEAASHARRQLMGRAVREA